MRDSDGGVVRGDGRRAGRAAADLGEVAMEGLGEAVNRLGEAGGVRGEVLWEATLDRCEMVSTWWGG